MQCRDRAVCGCFIRSAVNNSTSTTQTPAVATRKHQICPIFSPQKYCLKRLPWCLPVDSATCCSLWLWDWLLCFFPLRRLAEMETRNGSYLNDSISPNESMWEPLFLFFQYFPPSLPSIGLLCVNLLCRLCSHWLVLTVAIDMRDQCNSVVSDCFTFHKKLTLLCFMFIQLLGRDVLWL